MDAIYDFGLYYFSVQITKTVLHNYCATIFRESKCKALVALSLVAFKTQLMLEKNDLADFYLERPHTNAIHPKTKASNVGRKVKDKKTNRINTSSKR